MSQIGVAIRLEPAARATALDRVPLPDVGIFGGDVTVPPPKGKPRGAICDNCRIPSKKGEGIGAVKPAGAGYVPQFEAVFNQFGLICPVNLGALRRDPRAESRVAGRASSSGARHGQEQQARTEALGHPRHPVAHLLPRRLRFLSSRTPLHARPGAEMACQAWHPGAGRAGRSGPTRCGARDLIGHFPCGNVTAASASRPEPDVTDCARGGPFRPSIPAHLRGRRSMIKYVTLLAGMLLAAPAFGQDKAGDYPNRPIKIIVCVPAGGGVDTVTRIVADKLGQRLGRPPGGENRTGATGHPGAEYVYGSDPDGYTLLASQPAPLTVNVLLYKKINFDPTKFVPVAIMTEIPNTLTVRPDFPAKDMKEFIAYARAHPGKLNYASQ